MVRSLRFAGKTRAWLLLVPMLALAACNTTHVVSDYDHSVRFASLHTFTLITRPRSSTTNALVEQRTYEAIRAELTSKGFTYVMSPAEADFAVDFTIDASDRLDVRSSPAPNGGAWQYGGSSSHQVDMVQSQDGTLAIEVFDARTHKPVWHGSAKKRLSLGDIANSHTVIREAVTSVLANFPPKET